MDLNTYLLEAALVIEGAASAHPDLDHHGWFRDEKQPFEPTESSLTQVATALAYLDQCVIVKTPKEYSYRLKHCAENWGRKHGMSPYVSNGAFILAALHRGVPMKHYPHRSLNCFLAISKRSIAALYDDKVM